MRRWSRPFPVCWLAVSPGVAMLACIYAGLLIGIWLLADASLVAEPVSIVYHFLLLCGSSLDRALGILDDRGCVSVCVVCLGGSLLEDVRGSGCKSGVLIVGVMVAGVALGIGFGAVLNLHFLRKQQFLSVILPDPSTLIWYWWFGRAIMIFPVVFHWWFSGLCMATVSPVCNGGRLRVCLLYLSTILLFWWWRSSSQHWAAVTHLGLPELAFLSRFL